MHVLSADAQPLLTHALHFEVSVMPVTTETKASGSLQPPVLELEPPLLVPEPFEVEPELEPALPPRFVSGPILPVPLPELAPHATTTNPNPISPITNGCCMTSSSTASLWEPRTNQPNSCCPRFVSITVSYAPQRLACRDFSGRVPAALRRSRWGTRSDGRCTARA